MFTGHERDRETGLDYMLGRFYGSRIARFLSVDPVTIKPHRLWVSQRLNLYTYAANNPIKYFDPTGEDASFIVGPGSGPKEQYGHAAIYVSTENYSGGISYGGKYGFSKGKEAFIAGYTGDGRTVSEFKLKLTPEQEVKLAGFVKENPDGAVDHSVVGSDAMITQNCTTACGNALEASGAVPDDSNPGRELLDKPENLQEDLEEGGEHSDLVEEKVVHEPETPEKENKN